MNGPPAARGAAPQRAAPATSPISRQRVPPLHLAPANARSQLSPLPPGGARAPASARVPAADKVPAPPGAGERAATARDGGRRGRWVASAAQAAGAAAAVGELGDARAETAAASPPPGQMTAASEPPAQRQPPPSRPPPASESARRQQLRSSSQVAYARRSHVRRLLAAQAQRSAAPKSRHADVGERGEGVDGNDSMVISGGGGGAGSSSADRGSPLGADPAGAAAARGRRAGVAPLPPSLGGSRVYNEMVGGRRVSGVVLAEHRAEVLSAPLGPEAPAPEVRAGLHTPHSASSSSMRALGFTTRTRARRDSRRQTRRTATCAICTTYWRYRRLGKTCSRPARCR